ncbi:MAG: amidohydrolase [Chitinophagaceae bacterium]|nr:amidohydrolase [Chitinophagaceae bacterium]
MRSGKLFILTLFTSTLILFSSCGTKDPSKMAILYKNAYIWTGDSANPNATLLLTKGNKIIYVGYDINKLKYDSAVDVNGAMIVPGFMDNHSHFLSGGYQLESVNLREAKTPAEFINTMKEYMAGIKDNRWIQGGDWDHEVWGGRLPAKEWIDSITPNNPVFVTRYDGHMALANSLALKLAGIDKNTPVPPGGEIEKDSRTGELTGILRDDAMDLIYAKVPDPSEAELDEMFRRAQAHAIANGLTEVHDMGSYGGWTDMETYQRAKKNGEQQMRIYSVVALRTWDKLADYIRKNGKGDDMLRWGGLKGFVDGSLGSKTALFYKPYLDKRNSNGIWVTDSITLRNQILSGDSAGLQVMVHAIGDKAIDYLLDVYQEAEEISGSKEHRFRVEHAQHLSDSAFARFKELNVIASVQPYHAIDDGRWAYKRLDRDRLSRTYAFKTFLDSGVTMTFGSDWTVAPLSPILGIYAAVTRETLDGKNPDGWFPEQKIEVEDALRAYTVNNAYAGFQEDKTGMLKEGYYADFVILDKNLITIPHDEIKDVKVVQTTINGKTVFRKDK